MTAERFSRRGGSFFPFVAILPVTFRPSLRLNHPDERDIMLKWIPVVCATAGFICFYFSCYLTFFFFSSSCWHPAFTATLPAFPPTWAELLYLDWRCICISTGAHPWPPVAHLHLLQRRTRASQLLTPPAPSHLKVSDLKRSESECCCGFMKSAP